MKLSEKKKAAERLYMETDMSQKEIAKHIKVSENTLTNWVKKYKWDELTFNSVDWATIRQVQAKQSYTKKCIHQK